MYGHDRERIRLSNSSFFFRLPPSLPPPLLSPSPGQIGQTNVRARFLSENFPKFGRQGWLDEK